MPQVSKYAELWDTIKQDDATTKEGVAISALPRFHARIIKGVQKRKDNDLGFKFQVSEAGKGFVFIRHKAIGNLITFKLTYSISAEDL